MFDWTVNLGHVLTIIGFGGGAWATIRVLGDRVNALSKRMGVVEIDMRQIVILLVEQGRHEERLNGMDARILMYVQAQEQLKRQLDSLFEPSSHVKR